MERKLVQHFLKVYETDFFSSRFVRLVKIGTVVLLTFALIWSPFLKSVESGLQVANRLFPFARGLYEVFQFHLIEHLS